MTASDDELEHRVSILETETARLRELAAVAATDAAAARLLAARADRDVADARVLATGADRDVSDVKAELRAHRHALNALRETQMEHGQILGEHGRILGEHGRLIREHRQETSAGFATMRAGMEQIVAMLRTIAPDPPG